MRYWATVAAIGLAFIAGAVTYRVAIRVIPPVSARNIAPSQPAADYISERREFFKISQPARADIVMIGDSIIERGLWSEWTGCDIVNRGVGSDTAGGSLARLDEDALSLKPKKVYFGAGLNDINRGRNVDDTARDIRAALERIEASGAKAIWIVPVPVSEFFLNGWSATYLKQLPEKVRWLHRIEVTNAKLSADGIHLTAPVYKEIASKIVCGE